ncbi:hypothetical protein A3H10_03590 [Candidatus Uhrbacteria bacterium RIFCSPLOWO2_12_FULL_46_10]|uniref:Type II secretion system protein GspG C-terminal domain-containing protein n=1 Tax=Candidatus Uhrbacteria bacterium RIFCSPLOWO2_01_FULL_47_25 TaxID=1802402 RepID=A0A1F7UWR2_9BACT|nr:MAG: hypothetical protein A2752_02545 [Candidatus Uhrbacteria bacterium RIFCSPHIGHO2_01_FULL_46_23]OGL68737.1 MAG: hypothetical protein A3D60_02150 [Candidatus Uhrbacteria bacterium RIFCSPHIGHO2_02_FULL_47_29]OGL74763.1 MAG: hypothetical protein A3E96_03435 [Candidatus Uhrbacteria bacterium RIFCSPHIGHO2_12_FULL_46_13]OGL82174.1 MAG: hypothetical protein A2936_01265 [Candidatus Uhrbacteria bacterium RIFCSPLOWO2_01_FULL_47_25]OGL85683.1 MAG: hypothetical protein A3I37_04390 [Candidatus Uhrbact
MGGTSICRQTITKIFTILLLNFFKNMGVVKKIRSRLQGFTLIELLIVIGIIAVLAAATFVALNPLTRFQDARDARRRTDISAVLSAIKVNQVDNGGTYLAAIADPLKLDNTAYMIGTSATGCDDVGANAIACTDVTIAADADCINLDDGANGLVGKGYLGSIPIAPPAATTYTAAKTGYVLTKSAAGIITIQACDAENVAEIKSSR